MDGIRNAGIAPTARPLHDDLVGGVASMLWVLMGAIGAVLLIACANVANLLLVRADARRQELAVRAALGAGRMHIARESLAESFVLGAAGSTLGVGLAYAGLQALVANGPSSLPRLQEISVYPPVVAFTMVVALASTLLFGSITALQQTLRVGAPLVGGARGSSASRERSATRNTLVVVQVALAVVLVVSAALMIRTFQALRDIDPGFSDPATIQLARLFVPRAEFPDPAQYTRLQREMLDRIAAVPGVLSVSLSSEAPMESVGNNGAIEVEGESLPAGAARTTRKWKWVAPDYFATMGTRMVAGREIEWSDIDRGGRVVVISEDLARELAAEPEGALGKRIRLFPFPRDDWHEVIGVVQGIHHHGLYQAAPSSVYWPLLAENMFHNPLIGTPNATFAIRSQRASTASFVDEIRQAVRSVSASFPVAQVRTMQDLYAGSLARASFTLVLLGIAGAMALALGVIGIYGVIAYVVAQRARELGIRAALGARPRQLEGLFVRQGMMLTGIGAVVGLAAAVALARVMSTLLFETSPLDFTAYAVALGVTLAAAALASYLPARRAATIDPIETLRAD
jgi:predicted permease